MAQEFSCSSPGGDEIPGRPSAAVVALSFVPFLLPVLGAAFQFDNAVNSWSVSLLNMQRGVLGVVALVVAVVLIVVGRAAAPSVLVASVWLPLAAGVGRGVLTVMKGVEASSLGGAFSRPDSFALFCAEAAADVGVGGMLTIGLSIMALTLCARHPAKGAAALISNVALASGVLVGVTALGWAVQLIILASSSIPDGPAPGYRAADLAPLIALALAAQAVIAARKARPPMGELVKAIGACVVGGGGVVVAAIVATQWMFGLAGLLPHVTFPELKPVYARLGGLPGGAPRSVCLQEGVVAIGPGAESPMLLDQRADGAAIERCITAFAKAGAQTLQVVAQKEPPEEGAYSAALEPFLVVPRYLSGTLRTCQGTPGDSRWSPDRPPQELLYGVACFGGAPPTNR